MMRLRLKIKALLSRTYKKRRLAALKAVETRKINKVFKLLNLPIFKNGDVLQARELNILAVRLYEHSKRQTQSPSVDYCAQRRTKRESN